jgi:D-amino-acid oxidase
MRVAVVGGGVIGLTCALELTRAGHRVTVVSEDDPLDTTSAVAAALWFPYEAAPAADVARWGAASLARFTRLAEDPATGVALREGLVMYRRPDPDLAWMAVVPDAERVDDGVRARLPVIEMARYLRWLAGELEAGGASLVRRRVENLDDLEGPVVLAAGVDSGALAGDQSVVPIRGQVVRVGNPGLTDWIVDDENPGGLTYVVPRRDDVVVGGTAQRGSWDLAVDPAAEAAILARATALVPRLAGAPIVSRTVGLRPARPTVRLERAGRVVYCYGHGGAGVTLSWGCAADVVALMA